MSVVRRLLLLVVHGWIAGRRRLLVDDAIVRVVGWISHDRHLVDGLLVGCWVVGGWVLVAGHHVRRVGRAHRVGVDVVDRVTDDRTDNDDGLGVHRQDQVDHHGQAAANDENNVGHQPPIACD